MSKLHYPQFCALARAAELIGERWTLLIIRELLLGPKRFGDLLDHLDGMSPTLLASRLTELIDSNVVRKITLPRPVNAQLYELTEIGREIQPVIQEFVQKKVAVGRPFPPMTKHMRVSVGTAEEMDRFMKAFKEIFPAKTRTTAAG